MEDLRVGDIVLVRVRGRVYLRLIKAIDGQRCFIGNNHGGVNGWAGARAVYGIATEVEWLYYTEGKDRPSRGDAGALDGTGFSAGGRR